MLLLVLSVTLKKNLVIFMGLSSFCNSLPVCPGIFRST